MNTKLREVEQIITRVLFDESASKHTSMGVGGKLACLAFPHDEDELRRLIAFASREGFSYYAVGNWTNIIVADAGWEGIVISLMAMAGLEVKEAGAGTHEIIAQAGAPLGNLVALCASRGFTGMEFCAGIPGALGGAIKMNAGAFGKEMKEIVKSIRIMGGDGVAVDVPAAELTFAYRNLALTPAAIITAASLELSKGEQGAITAEIAAILQRRKERHPLEFRSAGSVFKNDKKWAAGRLIEEAGLKGKKVGDAEISNKHANFIVNRGAASAAEVLALIKMAQAEVLKRFGIALETEIKLLGF